MNPDYNQQDENQHGIGFREVCHAGKEDVVALELNPQGTRVAVASADHKVRVYDIDDEAIWVIVEQWRAHDAAISEVHWVDCNIADYIGTIGADNKFKLWREDMLQATNSGRRFRCVYSQSPSNSVSYAAFDFKSKMHESLLILLTFDGQLSLLESSRPDVLSSWNEIDELRPFGKHQRTLEPTYSLSLQRTEGPQAMRAGIDVSALLLAVSVGRSVKIYRAAKTGLNEGNYLLHEVLEFAVDSNINRIAWAPGVLRPYDVLALACDNAVVRLIDVIMVNDTTDHSRNAPLRLPTKGNVNTVKYKIEDMAPGSSSRSGTSAEAAGTAKTSQGFNTFRNEAVLGIEHRWSEAVVIPCGSGPVCALVWFLDGATFAASNDDGNTYTFKQVLHEKWVEMSRSEPS